MTNILAELARIKVLFQLRAIAAAIGVPAQPEPDQHQPRAVNAELGGRVGEPGMIEHFHGEVNTDAA